MSDGDHDANGRFVAGNRASHGNPYAPQMAVLRSALLEAVTPKDMTDVVRKLMELAKGGNVSAMKLLLSYTIGRVPDAVADTDDRPATLGDLQRLIETVAQAAGKVLKPDDALRLGDEIERLQESDPDELYSGGGEQLRTGRKDLK
ncbi:MAG: hypothetical protein ABIG44_06655 [Planctomycetota bacterium]